MWCIVQRSDKHRPRPPHLLTHWRFYRHSHLGTYSIFSAIVRNRRTWLNIKGAVFRSMRQNRQWAPESGTWWRQISALSPARMFSSDFPPAASSFMLADYVAQHFRARLLLDILHPEPRPAGCQCLLCPVLRVLRVTVSANGSFSPAVDAKFLALWVIVACYHLQPHPRAELWCEPRCRVESQYLHVSSVPQQQWRPRREQETNFGILIDFTSVRRQIVQIYPPSPSPSTTPLAHNLQHKISWSNIIKLKAAPHFVKAECPSNNLHVHVDQYDWTCPRGEVLPGGCLMCDVMFDQWSFVNWDWVWTFLGRDSSDSFLPIPSPVLCSVQCNVYNWLTPSWAMHGDSNCNWKGF